MCRTKGRVLQVVEIISMKAVRHVVGTHRLVGDE